MKKELWYLLAFIILILSFFYDKQIILWITNNRILLLNETFTWISFFGSAFMIFVISTSLFMWEEKKREWIPILWSSFLVAIAITWIIKFIAVRPRPETFLGITTLAKAFGSAFPSAHTAAVFATLPVLDKEFPMFKWFWIPLAIIIAYSRIYVGVHFLSDIIAGALIGFLAASCIVHLEEKYKFFKKWRSTKQSNKRH